LVYAANRDFARAIPFATADELAALADEATIAPPPSTNATVIIVAAVRLNAFRLCILSMLRLPIPRGVLCSWTYG
jgi:hypothetical protein